MSNAESRKVINRGLPSNFFYPRKVSSLKANLSERACFASIFRVTTSLKQLILFHNF